MRGAVFVTGAASGGGLAIAERFAREGWDFFITSRRGEDARMAAEELASRYGVFGKGYALKVYERGVADNASVGMKEGER